jgi:hypothetical protein
MSYDKFLVCVLTFFAVTAFGLAGCENKLSDEACMKLRGEAFEFINKAHTCNGDPDCAASQWPGCDKPVNKRNLSAVAASRKRFDDGKCSEPVKNCRKTPEIYCKQGLCVFREQPGQVNPGAK